MDFDVIVAGAGPAGSSAAYALARRGLSVLLLEKEALPRYKPCGGGLPGKVAQLLPFDLAPVVEQPITRGQVTSDRGEPVRYTFDQPMGWCVMRDRFDQLLAEQAAAAGARLIARSPVTGLERQPEGVRVETAQGAYTARVLVGADGANSRVARWAGLHRGRRFGAALEAELQVSPEAQETWRELLHLHFGGVPWGYAWVFPKAHHLSVGVGTFQDHHAVDLRDHLRAFLAGQPKLRAHTVRLLRGHRLPLGGTLAPLHAGPVLVAGDAGGFADPLLGEGIYYAISSGQLAAQVIVEALARPGPVDLAEYSRLANGRFHADFHYVGYFARVLYGLPGLGLALLRRSASLQAFTMRMLEPGFSMRRTLRRLRWWAPRLAWEIAAGRHARL